MKKSYEVLQTFWWQISLIFAISPYIPLVLQKKFGIENHLVVPLFCVTLLLFGLFVLALLFLWLGSDFCLPNPTSVVPVFFGAILGVIVSTATLLAISGITPWFYHNWIVASEVRTVLTVLMFMGMFWRIIEKVKQI